MSLPPSTPSTPGGWYPDPLVPGTLRYWDGNGWTQHTAPGTTPAVSQAAASHAAASQAAPARRGMHPGAVAAIVAGSIVVVLIIIGILAAIAIPVFLNQRQKADDAAARSDLHAINNAIMSAYIDDPANGPLTVVPAGDTVIVTALSSPDQVVQLSEQTEFGGYTSTPGSGTYCVWVDSRSSEKSFQADQMGDLTEGDCSSY